MTIQFDKFPISELHNHVEGGTLTPDLVQRFAQRNGLEYKAGLFTKEGVADYQKGVFADFLRAYDEISDYVITHEDVTDLVFDYLRRCHEEGAIYVELGCSPDHLKKDRVTYEQLTTQELKTVDIQAQNQHLQMSQRVQTSQVVEKHPGLKYPEFVKAVAEGIDRARKAFGIEARMVMILLRHNADVEGALEKDLDDIIQHPHEYVVGIGLAGDEFRYPPEKFIHLYARAKEAGLKLTAHAGEFANAASMRKAIEELQLDRVGHGVHCHEDQDLMSLLKENNIGLEICPSSNFHLDVFTKEEHPLMTLINAGVKVSINSDDPSFFGITLGHEWGLLDSHWHLNHQQKLKIARDSIEMSFAQPPLKKYLLSKIELYAAFHELAQVDNMEHILTEYKLTNTNKTLMKALDKIRATCQDIHIVKMADTLESSHKQYTILKMEYEQSLNEPSHKFKLSANMNFL